MSKIRYIHNGYYETMPIACLFQNNEGDIGISICSIHDRPNKQRGREIAEARSYKVDLDSFMSSIPKRMIDNMEYFRVPLKEVLEKEISKMKEQFLKRVQK